MDIGARDLAYALAADLRSYLDPQKALSFSCPCRAYVAFDVTLDEGRRDDLDAIGSRIRDLLRLASGLLLCRRMLTTGDLAEGFLRPPASRC